MKGAGFTFVCLLLLVMLAAGCSLFQRGEQSSPKRLVEAYMEAFCGGDFDRMVLLSGGWDGTNEELEFSRKFVELIELQTYTINQVDVISKNEAVVHVTVTLSLLGQEKTRNDRLRVMREDGKWYLEEGILE